MANKATRRTWLLGGLAAFAGLAGLGVGLRRFSTQDISPQAFRQLWSAQFQTPAGETLLFENLQGKPLVLNFWATWCPPCVEEMPLLERFYQENAAKGWQVVGVAIDQPSQVRRFLTQNSISYPIALGGLEGADLLKSLGNEQGALPFTLVLEAQGTIKMQKLGKLSEKEISSWL
jgi:thiol-disulfide isomerase/thioredoxin